MKYYLIIAAAAAALFLVPGTGWGATPPPAGDYCYGQVYRPGGAGSYCARISATSDVTLRSEAPYLGGSYQDWIVINYRFPEVPMDVNRALAKKAGDIVLDSSVVTIVTAANGSTSVGGIAILQLGSTLAPGTIPVTLCNYYQYINAYGSIWNRPPDKPAKLETPDSIMATCGFTAKWEPGRGYPDNDTNADNPGRLVASTIPSTQIARPCAVVVAKRKRIVVKQVGGACGEARSIISTYVRTGLDTAGFICVSLKSKRQVVAKCKSTTRHHAKHLVLVTGTYKR